MTFSGSCVSHSRFSYMCTQPIPVIRPLRLSTLGVHADALAGWKGYLPRPEPCSSRAHTPEPILPKPHRTSTRRGTRTTPAPTRPGPPARTGASAVPWHPARAPLPQQGRPCGGSRDCAGTRPPGARSLGSNLAGLVQAERRSASITVSATQNNGYRLQTLMSSVS